MGDPVPSKEEMELVIVTGLSGAGRTQTVRCFEDLGYFCIDNLPPQLIEPLVELCSRETANIAKIALGIDIRSGSFFKDLSTALEDLKREGIAYRILYLEASNDVLIRRFNETRRKHPLHNDVTVGLNLERQMLQGVRAKADKVIDTSALNSRQLWAMIIDLFMDIKKYKETVAISLLSFGFKYGSPADADIVFDVRFVPSPGFIEPLGEKSGLEPMVKEYVMGNPAAKAFVKKFTDLIEFLTGHFAREGKTYFTVAIGSEVGRHRSPAIVHELVGVLRTDDRKVIEWHRDIERH